MLIECLNTSEIKPQQSSIVNQFFQTVGSTRRVDRYSERVGCEEGCASVRTL